MLHKRYRLRTGNYVQVSLDKQANVILMDDLNYQNYKNHRSFDYYGGHAKVSPFTISVPHDGNWNLVIDGYAGVLRYSINII